MKPVKELLHLAALQNKIDKTTARFHWKTGKKIYEILGERVVA